MSEKQATEKTFERDGQTRTAVTPAQEINLRADGWTEKTTTRKTAKDS